MTPHNFRHLAATTIATENPEGVSDIALVLGHASFSTGEAHYNKARQSDALQKLQAGIEERRGSRRPPPLDADRVESLLATFETSTLQHAPQSTLEGACAQRQTGYPLLDWRADSERS